LPPAQVPPDKEPPPKPSSKSQSSGWLIPAAIVAAGVLLAAAVVLSRGGDDEAILATVPTVGSPLPEPSVAPVPVTPASPVDTTGDALAQVNLQSVASSAQAIYATSGSYLAATSFDMATQLPDLTFVDPITESTNASEISISTATTTFAAAAKSDSGTCWWVRVVADGTFYGTGASCTGASAGGAQSSAWPSPSPGIPLDPSPSASASGTLSATPSP
jgi:hypothetical protein